jgi:pimeloyl-ACP methyl ester carboxylesterase
MTEEFRMAEEFAPPPVSPEAIADLRMRLERRIGAVVAASDGDRGIDLAFLDGLLQYWASEYDWAPHEARIRRLPWEIAGEAHPIRLVHQRAGADRPTVLLLHGWPDSILRFERVLPLLAPLDLNVVVPALPGFPFALTRQGMSSRAMADAVGDAMSALGYERYVVSAGDVGCDVAEALAARRPEGVSALHLTDVSQYHFLVDPPQYLSAAEREYVERGHRWQAREGGYMHEQSTKPNTVATALSDSPSGLAAWIVEKLVSWTDCDGHVERVFSRDEILTWVSAYWFGGCIGTSFTPYAESGAKPWGRIAAPVAFTVFPKDLVNAPREFADRFFTVRHWEQMGAGGHFAAWEQPDAYLSGIRVALSLAE